MQRQSTLPLLQVVPVEHLAAGFDSVTNSYKFYWLLAILTQEQECRGTVLAIDALTTQMVAEAWYPSRYFRLPFGKQDQLDELVLARQAVLNLPAHSPKAEVTAACLRYTEENVAFGSALRSLTKHMQYRLLSPYFTAEALRLADWEVNEEIWQLAAQHFTSAAPLAGTRRSSVFCRRTSRPINSAKNDQLPGFACYFELFAVLQVDEVQVVASQGKAVLLEDLYPAAEDGFAASEADAALCHVLAHAGRDAGAADADRRLDGFCR